MNQEQAIKIAIECIESQQKLLANYANRYHMHPDEWPELRRKWERYAEYGKAIQTLIGMKAQKRFFTIDEWSDGDPGGHG